MRFAVSHRGRPTQGTKERFAALLFAAASAISTSACSENAAVTPALDQGGTSDPHDAGNEIGEVRGGRDAAPFGEDAGMHEDASARVDGSAVEAGPIDAEPAPLRCEDCAPTSPCEVARCVLGQCVRSPAEARTACGEDGSTWCSYGECVRRGCGDGLRELSDLTFARESCDDGNLVEDDGCTSSCQLTPVLLEEAKQDVLSTYPSLQGASAATDGRGRVLRVWVRKQQSAFGVVAAMTAARGSAVKPELLQIRDGISADPSPSAAGLASGGFVVAFADGGAVFFTYIDAQGKIVRTDRAHAAGSGQTGAQVAATSSGFVVAWVERDVGVLAQVFSASGSKVGGVLTLSTVPAARVSDLRLAAIDEDWLVLWRERGVSLSDPTSLVGRRFSRGHAVDPSPATLVRSTGSGAALAAGPTGYAVAWNTVHDVGLSDVFLTTLGRTSPWSQTMTLAVSERADVREVLPVVSPLAEGFFVAWTEGYPGALRARAVLSTEPKELSLVRDRWALGGEGSLSVARGADGSWISWTGTDGATVRSSVSSIYLPDR